MKEQQGKKQPKWGKFVLFGIIGLTLMGVYFEFIASGVDVVNVPVPNGYQMIQNIIAERGRPGSVDVKNENGKVIVMWWQTTDPDWAFALAFSIKDGNMRIAKGFQEVYRGSVGMTYACDTRGCLDDYMGGLRYRYTYLR